MLRLSRPELERSSRQGPVQSLPEFPEDFDNGQKDQCVGDCGVAGNLHHYCR